MFVSLRTSIVDGEGSQLEHQQGFVPFRFYCDLGRIWHTKTSVLRMKKDNSGIVEGQQKWGHGDFTEP